MKLKKFMVFLVILSILTINFTLLQGMADTPQNILILSEEIDDSLKDRFQLDPFFSVTIQSQLTGSLDGYSGIILYDYAPKSSEYNQILSFSGGIASFIGASLLSNSSILLGLNMISDSVGELINTTALPEPIDQKSEHELIANIRWNSVVQIRNFTSLPLANTILIETSSESKTPNIPLVSTNNDNSRIAINFLPSEQANSEFIQWPYFNYFLNIILNLITSQKPQSYADWPYSPVPHKSATIGLGLMVLLTSAITIAVFIFVKHYSSRNPIKEEDLEEISKEIKEEKDWEDIGMHRQLAGFFVQLFIGLIIILPNVVMSSLIFPLYILPSPQAAGFYDFTIRFFEVLWLMFDIGTSVVLVKFFSQHRVKNPQQAVKYIQIFIYYQMISGVLQLFLVSFIGSIFFPRSFLAHLSWLFVTHAFFQWPAFFVVFMLIFQAMNRHDMYQILNILLYGVFNITIQYGVIVIFRVTLGKNPIFGDGLAGAIGYSVGNYVIQVVTFLLGLWMFKRQKFSLKSIFRIDFSMAEIKESLSFGFKWMIGNILPPLGWFAQMFLLSTFLPNYTEQQGYFSLAWNFALIVMIAGLFAQSILPGVSESYHGKKKVLTRYYTLNSLKWGAYFDWFFVSALLAIGPRFIIGGAGEEWASAAIIIRWILLFHFFGYLSWIGDWMFAGSDRPGWAAISWVIEQVIRTGLLVAFIPAYKFFTIHFNSPMVGVLFAYIPALIIKNAFMWWGIRRDDFFKFRWKDLWYQGVVTPLLSALALFSVLELLFTVIWKGEIITSVVILLIGIIPGLYLFAFFMGLFGGFDDNTLAEFKRSTDMVKGVGFMARPLYKLTEWGTKISPLHNRFPISIYNEAIKEAEELTKEKAKLVI
ncbi:MAG: lipopolysaccharide biosynthesis protein [Candidatus Heimdallarchaeaceae archaeon]